MSDDIVTRLREEADSWCHDSAVRVFLEAADGIERLRKEVEVWRKIAHIEHSAWSQCPSDCLCLAYDFMKAVRGE